MHTEGCERPCRRNGTAAAQESAGCAIGWRGAEFPRPHAGRPRCRHAHRIGPAVHFQQGFEWCLYGGAEFPG